MQTLHDFGSISGLDGHISRFERVIPALPHSDPLRHTCIGALAMAYSTRYNLSSQKEDLDKSILHFTQAIFLTPPRVKPRQNIVRLFFFLASELLRRSQKSKRPSDVRFFKTNLALALGILVEIGSRDAVRDIDEMTTLCRELLNSGISQGSLAEVLLALFSAVDINRKQSPGHEPSEQVIKCLREANACLDFHPCSQFLAILLFNRFQVTYSIEDYEEAMALLDGILASHPRTDCPGSCVEPASDLTVRLAMTRSAIFGNPEYSEEAIVRLRAFLAIAPTDNPCRIFFTEVLAALVEQRFCLFGVPEGPEEAHSRVEVACLPSFSDLAVSLAKSTDTKSQFSMTGEEENQHLHALLSASRTTDIAEIEHAIKYCRQLLASIHRGDPFALQPAITLAELLFRAFEGTRKIEYLDESIVLSRDIATMSYAQWVTFRVTRNLIMALSSRIVLLRDWNGFDELMRLFSVAANDLRARVTDRFENSCQWASLARTLRHPTTSTAYESALSLMQDSLLFAPTLETQHFGLVALPSNEALEQGRALLWSEMRGFRTSIDQLHAVDPHLAEEFTVINRNLEILTMSIFPGGGKGDGDRVEGEGMDLFGPLVMQQRKLLARRDELVLLIQSLPGFERFFKTQSFDTLRSAALRGPVIIINHCKWRSDILVLHHNSRPSLVTTLMQYQRALRSVLKSLFELIGQPIIEELRRLKVPEQSRIWWCPTSVLCSLPLHAMGPIPSNDVLLVANPDEYMSHALPEIWLVKRLDARVTTLMGRKATPTAVVEGLQDHRFAHFICHGNLEPEKPFNAHRAVSTSCCRIRFLSACHTAELSDGSIADEGLHLTAAVQYCGFRSVVGTMWAMADEDGEGLAALFYASMFSSDEPGVPYHEKSARALRDAVQSLRRKKRLPLEQWVNFVHYGA
ncbi:hypothetical protein BC826DRAFT_1016877 [Russula brevipes]|nr:hypothetical protein BC826DRAFT_1016877 [Russula brevipes]